MAPSADESAPISIPRLVAAPAAITLCVTLVRLAGELGHWSEGLFNRTMGWSIVAIIWLAPIVGIYFALKLAKSGAGPKSFLSSVGYSLLGVVVLLIFAFAPSMLKIQHGFYDRLLYGWAFFVVAALVTRRGWPQLFKVLAVYGFAARIPVAVIMFFAFRGNWGTHYDAVPLDMPALGLTTKYLWLGFFPQLTLWVAYTILAGMLFGTIVSGIARVVRIERGLPV
ncbi:MAG: hypothetical protein HY508_06575 [Acidobacteria bacterium]|nr:hypothetical protein [Acidobacteriota bacterium]